MLVSVYGFTWRHIPQRRRDPRHVSCTWVPGHWSLGEWAAVCRGLFAFQLPSGGTVLITTASYHPASVRLSDGRDI
jgi:hypothetical protein